MTELMFALHLIVLVMATWRLSSLFASEEGPFDIFLRLRMAVGMRYDHTSKPYFPLWEEFKSDYPVKDQENGFVYLYWSLGKGMCCPWCNSIWIGFILMFIYLFWQDGVIALSLPLALSAGAILIESIVRR
jgi:hypothetical protein